MDKLTGKTLDDIAAERKQKDGNIDGMDSGKGSKRGRGRGRGRRGMRRNQGRQRSSFGRGRRSLSQGPRRDVRKRIRISGLLPIVNNEDLKVKIFFFNLF